MTKDKLIDILTQNSETKNSVKNINANQTGQEKTLQKEEQESQKKLDPTHFGDWQVDCRTIDF